VIATNDKTYTLQDIADILQVSFGVAKRLKVQDRLPAPVDLGIEGAKQRLLRWRREDIQRWLDLGCPSRADFERLGKS
jgi:predicted DNA-binding transcriptional regulator AlpA